MNTVLMFLILFVLIWIWVTLTDIFHLLARLNKYVDFLEKKSPRKPLKDNDVVMVINGHEITYAQMSKKEKP